MPWIDTSELSLSSLPESARQQVYNALDCCLTHEINAVLQEQIRQRNDPSAKLIYDFERGMEAPALDMMLRGIKIDRYEQQSGIWALTAKAERLQYILERFGEATLGQSLWAKKQISRDKLKHLLYDLYKLPPQYRLDKGERKLTVNREALEKLSSYAHVLPIINAALASADVSKLLSIISSEVSPDGRMRTNYNVAGTETGRWSSSADVWDTGTNLQNITPELRKMFVADPGMKMAYLDLEQAESKVVGLVVWLTTGDDSYWYATQSSDLHTYVCQLVWQDLPWSDSDVKHNREVADGSFYRQFSHRDMGKRGGHATNYRVTPPTMARHLKIEQRIAYEFQMAYFTAFPGIPRWHTWVARQIGLHAELTTPLGRSRTFYGRTGDDATIREAIAFVPQSTVGDLLNVALWRLWKSELDIQLLAQVHDAILLQYPEEREHIVLPECIELMRIPFSVTNDKGETRTLIIPVEAKVGWNWADEEIRTSRGTIQNPGGLRKWKGDDNRRRPNGVDRIVA